MTAIFIVPLLTGGLLVHVLWPDREIKNLVLKAFLGVGIGLGINSLSYFLYLSLFAGQHWFIAIQLISLLLVAAVAVWQARRQTEGLAFHSTTIRLSRLQVGLLAFSGVIFIISLASTASYILRRKQGDWDAWMMFNRAARFVYRDQIHWLSSFSRQMDPMFHADYPLFLAMNIASGWDTLANETPRVPMIQSAVFAIACAGLFTSALMSTKTPGQAALGLIILWGTPAVVNEGARELADLPLAYFFLATGILIYLYVLHRKAGLLVLAGITAGLAAWMKNEGSVFMIAAGMALVVGFIRERPFHKALWYGVGLAIPLAVVLYFKLVLAPPSDVLSNGPARSIAQLLEASRHMEILQAFWQQVLSFGGWVFLGRAIGIIPVLLVYLIVSRDRPIQQQRAFFAAAAVMLAIQALGYYAVYVITPYDLQWHLSFSIERVFLQMFPLLAFAILCATRPPESVLGGA